MSRAHPAREVPASGWLRGLERLRSGGFVSFMGWAGGARSLGRREVSVGLGAVEQRTANSCDVTLHRYRF